jgi:hypothetical protein
MEKKEALKNFVLGRGRFVLNQKVNVFGDKRTKRNKTRSEQKRRAIDDNLTRE